MTLLPAIFLSGFFFPLEAMPRFLQLISLAMPLRYYLIVIRSILLKGSGLDVIMPQVIALIIFAVVIMGAAALRFKKRLD
jgi:ABC-2 type transport system permease protein